jgi:energy-coupling factor transporter ATP-binding protein EcfA2
MKQLVSIKLVQFFLYEKREVRLGRTCGIFGANGSGKSSLLDAVQIVLFGGHGRHVSFNAQADESNSNKRTVRTYCLGQYGDEDHMRVRQEATTYITLGWQDTRTQEIVSTGICIYSSGSREKHEVLGRYAVTGDIAMLDHLEVVDGKESPREWSAFRVMIQQRAAAHGEEALFHDSDRFVKEILFRLRGSGKTAPSYEAFVQAFRFALRMKFDQSVDSIVRHQVLESRPVDVRKFRQVLSTVQDLAALVKQVKEKLADAGTMETEFSEAARKSREAATWQAAERAAALEVENVAVDAAELAEGRASDDLTAKLDAQEHAKKGDEEAAQAASAAATARDSHSAHTAGEQMRSSLAKAEQTASAKWADFRRSFGLFRAQLETAAKSTFLETSNEKVRAAATGLVGLGDVKNSVDRADVEFPLRRGMEAAKAACEELLSVRRAIGDEIRGLEQDVDAAKGNLQRLSEGKQPLDRGVTRLKGELADNGIETTPVCDLVQVSDVDWQPIVESFLGPWNLQALLVAEQDERHAFRIYRGMQGLYDVKLARASRHAKGGSPKSGSVAELIVGLDTAAVNFLRNKFTDAQRAESEEDCFNFRHALTKDGMHLIDGEVTRRRRVDSGVFKMGVKVGAERRDQLDLELLKAEDKLGKARTKDGEARALYDALILFGSSIDERMNYLMVEVFDAARAADGEASTCREQLEALQTDQYAQLVADALEAATFAQSRKTAYVEASTDVARAEQTLISAKAKTLEAQAKRLTAGAELEEAKRADGCDLEAYADYWDSLVTEFGEDYSAMRARCLTRRNARIEDIKRRVNQGQSKLGEFTLKYQEHPPIGAREDWRVAHSWIVERIEFLENTELKSYDGQMQEALRTARDSFRNDVAVTLNDNIERMRETFDKMNQALEQAPAFSNGDRYKFKRTIRPAYEGLLKFIKDVATYGTVEDLLGGPGELPPEFEELMRDKTAPGAGAVKTPLDDYREFFEFDVQVWRKDPVTGQQKVVAHLSTRVGSGSGGEHRAPLYVIAGAALASAYRLQPGDDSGMRLIMLDEAFNKMDPRNIIATMRYFEELGLQMFAASTGEAQGTLNGFLDRYYDIMRDPERNIVLLEGHDLSDEAREIFRSDLPEFHPELVDEEIATMYTSAAEAN